MVVETANTIKLASTKEKGWLKSTCIQCSKKPAAACYQNYDMHCIAYYIQLRLFCSLIIRKKKPVYHQGRIKKVLNPIMTSPGDCSYQQQLHLNTIQHSTKSMNLGHYRPIALRGALHFVRTRALSVDVREVGMDFHATFLLLASTNLQCIITHLKTPVHWRP